MIYLYYICVFLLLNYPRIRIIQYISLFLMFVLFAFNDYNADRYAYEYRLYEYNDENLFAKTEYGFTYLMFLFNRLGLEIQSLYFFTATISLTTIYIITKKLTKNVGFVLGVYMINAFFFDVVQLRFTLSLVFVYWGLYFYLTIKDSLKCIVLYIVFIALASTFHFASLYFILFVVARFYSRKSTIVASCVFAVVLASVSYLAKKYFYSFQFYEKIENVEDYASTHFDNHGLVVRTFFLVCIVAFFFYVYYITNKSSGVVDYTYRMYASKFVILLLPLIPFMAFSLDAERVFIAYILYNSIFCSRWLEPVNAKIICMGNVITVGYIFYRLIYLGNPTTVFYAILTQNILLK